MSSSVIFIYSACVSNFVEYIIMKLQDIVFVQCQIIMGAGS